MSSVTTDDTKQITVDQILSDVYSKRKQTKLTTKIDILDLDELKEFQRRKRKEYEGYLKRNRLDMGQWMRYAIFEVEQHDMRRARSIFERALLVSGSHIPMWIRYIDSELKVKCLSHARNLLDRAITTLPRVDKLWYKYLFLEESLENWDIVRALFNKWCSLEPERNVWDAYLQFEIRRENWENVRDIYSRYILLFPGVHTWIDWIKFESIYGKVDTTRDVYSIALDTLMSYRNDESMENYDQDVITLILSFANWEVSRQEYERARTLFKIAIKEWPQDKRLINNLTKFEQNFGDLSKIKENVIFTRKKKYEDQLSTDKYNYFNWMLYLDLIIQYFPQEVISSFENSVKDGIPKDKKMKSTLWRRYIYLWIRYISYVELELHDIELCRTLYKRCLNDIVPHKNFTFAKIWIMYSNFEIRQNNLPLARKILGRSIGLCPKNKLFKKYIELEIKLKEFDRVRKLYEKYLEFTPSNSQIWINYSELEENLGDEERCRAIYKIALRTDVTLLSLNDQLRIMDKFISFETDSQEYNNARSLYEDYLLLIDHTPKVWIEYAMYESSTPTDQQIESLSPSDNEGGDSENEDIEFEPTEENFECARKIYERSLLFFKERNNSKSRSIMFEAYQEFEKHFGDDESQTNIMNRMPSVVKRTELQDNIEREYNDYVFPDDQDTKSKPNVSKFLALAKKWKEGENSDIKKE